MPPLQNHASFISLTSRTARVFAFLAAAVPLADQGPNCVPTGTPATPSVFTAQYDNYRDAHNSNETWLNASNDSIITATNSRSGNGCLTQLGFLQVDVADLPTDPTTMAQFVSNPIYAQPLYVPSISVDASYPNCGSQANGYTCSMVVSATLNGTLFAWNAVTLEPIWNREGMPQDPAVSQWTVGNALWYDDCEGGSQGARASAVPVTHVTGTPPLALIGTVSTPVIDPGNLAGGHPAMFVSSYCHNTGRQNLLPTWFLHEIDLETGLDIGQPYQINQSSPGTLTFGLSVPCIGPLSDCNSSGTMYFTGSNQNRRPALLEVSDSSVSSYPLVEVAFGALVDNIESAGSTVQFHGWLGQFLTLPGYCQTPGVCGLATASQGSPNFIHNTSSAGPATGSSPPCSTSAGNDWAVSGGSVIQGSQMLPDQANKCGEAGTFWASTRGPAAIADDSDTGATDVFLTSANGPFQTSPQSSSGQNTGQSILRFNTRQTGAGAVPSDSFTPHGQQQFATGVPGLASGPQYCGPVVANLSTPAGYSPTTYMPCTPALQPPQVDSACNYDPNGGGAWTYCQTSVEVASNADWDMGTPGVILFQDNSTNWWLVTSDKAGYAYVLDPYNLQGFQAYDPGNQFPFAAAKVLGPNLSDNQQPGQTGLPADPDRITSLAFYAWCSSGSECSNPTGQLYFWPKNSTNSSDPVERLTSLQLTPGGGTQTLAGAPFTHCQNGGSGADACTGGPSDGQWTLSASGSGAAFLTQVVAGDTIVACGCTPQAIGQPVQLSSCPIATSVTADTSLTMSKGFTEYVSSSASDCSPLGTVGYSGMFTNPSHDTTPPPKGTGYPGGVVQIASSALNSDDGLLVGVITDKWDWEGNIPGGTLRTEGNLYIYNAIANSGYLAPLWTTDTTNTSVAQCGPVSACQTFCAAPFALPTVVGGEIFLPTYAILPLTYAPNTNDGSPVDTVPCPTDDPNSPTRARATRPGCWYTALQTKHRSDPYAKGSVTNGILLNRGLRCG